MLPPEKLLATLDRILPANRTTVDGIALLDAILRTTPSLSASPDRRDRFLTALRELEKRGEIVLPGPDPANWERGSPPPLPLRFRRVRVRQTSTVSPENISWRPELAFAAGMRGMRPQLLKELLRMQEFLSEAVTADRVPVKERSYLLFGDEKRLEALLEGEVGDHLSLDTLRVFIPRLVPVHQEFAGVSSPHILVIENESTFDSFARWNESRRRFAMVVYGRGQEAPKYAHFLVNTAARTGGGVYYFGDLDGYGVQIAHQLATEMKEGGAPSAKPLVTGYLFLAQKQPTTDDASPPERVWSPGLEWLPIDVREVASNMFRDAKRVAQEAFGWVQLSGLRPENFP